MDLSLFHMVDLPVATKNPRTPDNSGYIVESHMNLRIMSQGHIVFIDKGEKDGVQIGDVFSVFTDSPVQRPIGEIQVVSLRPTTSGAVISDSSSELTVGLQWGKK